MKKKIGFVIAGIIIVLFIFWYAHIAKANIIYDKSIDTSDYRSTDSFIDEKISQEFRTDEESIDGISVKSRIIGEPYNVVVSYSLADTESGEIVARGTENAANIANSKFHKFEFADKVEGTKGKRFNFILEVFGEDNENHIAFCYEDKTEMSTRLTINDTVQDGTLILKTITNRFDIETFVVLLLFIAYIIVFMKFLYKLFK